MGNRFFFLLFIVDGTLSFVCVCGWVHACVSQRSTHAGFFFFFFVNVRVIVSLDWLTVSSIDKVHVQLLQLFLAVTECLQCWPSCISALNKQQKVMEDNGNISSYTWIVSFCVLAHCVGMIYSTFVDLMNNFCSIKCVCSIIFV